MDQTKQWEGIFLWSVLTLRNLNEVFLNIAVSWSRQLDHTIQPRLFHWDWSWERFMIRGGRRIYGKERVKLCKEVSLLKPLRRCRSPVWVISFGLFGNWESFYSHHTKTNRNWSCVSRQVSSKLDWDEASQYR